MDGSALTTKASFAQLGIKHEESHPAPESTGSAPAANSNNTAVGPLPPPSAAPTSALETEIQPSSSAVLLVPPPAVASSSSVGPPPELVLAARLPKSQQEAMTMIVVDLGIMIGDLRDELRIVEGENEGLKDEVVGWRTSNIDLETALQEERSNSRSRIAALQAQVDALLRESSASRSWDGSFDASARQPLPPPPTGTTQEVKSQQDEAVANERDLPPDVNKHASAPPPIPLLSPSVSPESQLRASFVNSPSNLRREEGQEEEEGIGLAEDEDGDGGGGDGGVAVFKATRLGAEGKDGVVAAGVQDGRRDIVGSPAIKSFVDIIPQLSTPTDSQVSSPSPPRHCSPLTPQQHSSLGSRRRISWNG